MNQTPAPTIPTHIAIIMDGNRRWARQHKLEALQGHSYVANKVLQPLIEHCIELGIKYVTLWAFSTENWHRDESEVAGLMNLFRDAFKKNAKELHEKGVRLQTIGDISRFPNDLQQCIKEWVETTKNNDKITVIFALNYGGRDELVRGVNQLIQKAKQTGELENGFSITTESLNQVLDTATLPDPDLIIRPGGEQRLSGFLPWQSVYSELYFTDTLMPDFSPAELDKAVSEFTHRQRRFGA